MTDVIRLLRDVAARNGAALRYAHAFDEFSEYEQLYAGTPEAEVPHELAIACYRAWAAEMNDPSTRRPPSRYDPHDRGAA